MSEVLKKTWITVREGAEIVGVSVQRMHQLIHEYELETTSLHSRLKVMRRNDAEKIKRMDRPSGVRRDARKKPTPPG